MPQEWRVSSDETRQIFLATEKEKLVHGATGLPRIMAMLSFPRTDILQLKRPACSTQGLQT